MVGKKQSTFTFKEFRRLWRHVPRLLYDLIKLKYITWKNSRALKKELARLKAQMPREAST